MAAGSGAGLGAGEDGGEDCGETGAADGEGEAAGAGEDEAPLVLDAGAAPRRCSYHPVFGATSSSPGSRSPFSLASVVALTR